MNLSLQRLACSAALLITTTVVAWGQFIAPVSYVASSGGVGTFTYFDESGTQLIDGVLGVDDWTADLGHGNAQEWVGWTTPAPSITFTFTGNPTIQSVLIGFNRSEATGSIFLPTTVTISGVDFPVDFYALPDGTRGFLAFTGPWTGNTLQIDMVERGPFTFVDEIRFSSVAVPEPATWILLALGGAIALLARRRVTRFL